MTTTSLDPGEHEEVGHRDPRCAGTTDDDLERGELPTDDAAGVDQPASTTIAVPCWSSWNTGMSSSSLSRRLDLEAARRGDVLQVDPAEGGRDPRDCVHQRVDVAGLQAHRHGVHVGEVLEEDRLALHDRHRAERADVTEAQHRRAVRDDRDRVVAGGVAPRQARVLGDRQAHVGHAGGVEQREIVGVPQGLGRPYLDLAALVGHELRRGEVVRRRGTGLSHGVDLRTGSARSGRGSTGLGVACSRSSAGRLRRRPGPRSSPGAA